MSAPNLEISGVYHGLLTVKCQKMEQERAEALRNPESQRTLQSARLEIVIVLVRIAEALEALPRDADALTIRQWNTGIARELVSS